jgi:hypothetical protein
VIGFRCGYELALDVEMCRTYGVGIERVMTSGMGSNWRLLT